MLEEAIPGFAGGVATPDDIAQAATPAAAPSENIQQGAGIAGTPASPKPEPGLGAALNFFRDPERLRAAALAAAAAQKPEVMAWLKRGYEAQRENYGEALAKVISGDRQGAINIFNANGDMKAVGIEDGKEKGFYKITLADGTSREINPEKELLTLVTPPQMLQHMRNEEALRVREDLGNKMIESRNTATEARAEAERARAGQRDADHARRLAESEARIANLHAQTANTLSMRDRRDATPINDPNAPKPISRDQFTKGVRQAVSDTAEVDPITNKKKPGDPSVGIRLKVLAETLWEKDHTLTPAEAVDLAQQAYEEAVARATEKVDKEIAGAKKAVEVKATSPSSWGNLFSGPDLKGKKEPDYRKERVKEETERELKAMTGGKAPAAKDAPAKLPPTNAKGWKLHTDKNGNRAYVSPDGKQFEEVK